MRVNEEDGSACYAGVARGSEGAGIEMANEIFTITACCTTNMCQNLKSSCALKGYDAR